MDYKPTERLKALVLALKYDDVMTPLFKPHQRHSINLERAAIMRGDESFKQPAEIEAGIQTAVIETNRVNWYPDINIYG